MTRARCTWALVAATALASAAPARRAEACGDSSGGGGSSNSSSSSSSSSGSGSDGGVIVETPACTDASDVVGYRTCTPYGTWGTLAQLPRVSFDVGVWSSVIDLAGLDVGGTMTHGDGTSYAYRVTGAMLGDEADVVGLRSRLLLHHGGTYVGLEGGAGGIVTGDDVHLQPMQRVDLASRGAIVAAGGIVAGAQVTTGRLALGGELVGGLRGVSVTSTSTYGACITDDVAWSARPMLEVRARGDLWLTPWISAGAYLGRDALGGQTSAGLDLGIHLRAFDGR